MTAIVSLFLILVSKRLMNERPLVLGMAMQFPDSMDELVYFTRRKLDTDGKAIAWVYRQDCPKCKKAKMGKPVDEKTGKPKTRAKEYVCPACGYTVPKDEYEETLQLDVMYTCPHCHKEGEYSGPFHRKSIRIFDVEKQKKVAAKGVKFKCQHCQGEMVITQKMK